MAAARLWLGTPYVHQHRVLGQGVDCIGVIIAAGLATGVLDFTEENFEPWHAYGRTPNPAKMAAAMAKYVRPLVVADPLKLPDASVMWLGWRENLPMHLALLGTAPDGRRTMLHAYGRIGKTVEHGFVAEWPDMVESWWEYPGLTGV